MLTNVSWNRTAATKSMEEASFQFHLTGSRFFGFGKPDSDWDFFVEYVPGLVEWLRDNDFTLESDTDYSSVDIEMVWRHARQPIHIQVVRNATLKEKVQNALNNNLFVRHKMYRVNMTKEARKVLWDVAFALYEAGEEAAVRSLATTR